MTPKKVLEVLDLYEQKFTRLGIEARKENLDTILSGPVDRTFLALMHARSMLADMRRFVDEGRMDKVFRWLGFVQGVLWTNGWYTLAELMDHNRPSGSTFDASA